MNSVCQEKDDVYEELPLFELEKIYCTEEQKVWLKEKIVDRLVLREVFIVSGRIALCASRFQVRRGKNTSRTQSFFLAEFCYC